MNTIKKGRKLKSTDRPLPKVESDNSSNEVKVYINEKYKAKVISEKNIEIIKNEIPFQMYHLTKNVIKLSGNNVQSLRAIASIFESLYVAYKNLKNIENEYLIIDELYDLLYEVVKENGRDNYIHDQNAIIKTHKNKYISPRTVNQELFVDSARSNVITICRGVAGTGKSALAVAVALAYLQDNRYDKLLLVRPLTTVGGKDMGFMPGNLDEKYGPFASPLINTIIEYVGEPKYNDMIKDKKIILTPTSFVRGDNFKDAIIIIDEAQNLTDGEIFTLLTRICHNSKVIITGDESQDDRKDKFRNISGLSTICNKLMNIDNVGIITMTVDDIQRHGIVRDIIEAFE